MTAQETGQEIIPSVLHKGTVSQKTRSVKEIQSSTLTQTWMEQNLKSHRWNLWTSGHNGSYRNTNEEICNSSTFQLKKKCQWFINSYFFCSIQNICWGGSILYLFIDGYFQEFQHHTFYLGQNTWRTAKNSQICICFISPCLHLLPLCLQYCRKTINTTNGEHLSWLTRPILLCLLPTFMLSALVQAPLLTKLLLCF